LVPRTSQTIAATASCAVQTDAATVSLWDLLPKARNEAYDRGFHAGKNDGYAQGVGQSNSIGKKEGLAIRFEKGQPEGLKGGLARGKEVEIQRGIGIGREAGYANSLAEGIRQAKEEIKKQGQEDTSAHKPQEITTREKIVVKLPPTSAAIILKKQNEERAKPKSSGVDPFASLLDLARKK
jgi:flagellar biosynthesis/type III secretory pathway protein FliH